MILYTFCRLLSSIGISAIGIVASVLSSSKQEARVNVANAKRIYLYVFITDNVLANLLFSIRVGEIERIVWIHLYYLFPIGFIAEIFVQRRKHILTHDMGVGVE